MRLWWRQHARPWLGQLVLALNQLGNVLLTPLHGGAFADETISSRAYRAHRAGRPLGRIMKSLIDRLFLDPNHCRDAYENGLIRHAVPPERRS